MAARTIAIVGATGAQGGGLVGAITADRSGEFAARALTRSPGSAKAAALAAAGVDVVAADTDDVESLKRAFDGADAVFCLTNYWEHFSVEREQAQARNMARGRKGRRRAARDLVDARGHAQLGAARRQPDADAARPLQGPALRLEGRGRPVLPRRRRADDVPADVVLLGQLHLLRARAQAGARRRARHHAADGRPQAAGHRRRDIGPCALGVLQRGRTWSARPSASPAST